MKADAAKWKTTAEKQVPLCATCVRLGMTKCDQCRATGTTAIPYAPSAENAVRWFHCLDFQSRAVLQASALHCPWLTG